MNAVASETTTGAATRPFSLAQPRRIVLDTNVLLSLYVFADSRFAPLRAEIESGRWRAFANAATLDEFRRVLAYPQFGVAAETRENIVAAYADVASCMEMTATTGKPLPRCKDRDDQKFLELARDAAAEWLVTADKALLKLARRQKLAGLFDILTPLAALESLTLNT